MIDRAGGPVEPGRDAPQRPAEPPVTVRLGSPGRGPGVAAALITVFVALALIKPWDGGPGAPRQTPRITAVPVEAPSIDPLAELRHHCQEPVGWRIYSHERWATLTVRSWKSFIPASIAEGPLDPVIPVIPLAAVIDGLGYCSPWTGAERPPDSARVRAWRIAPIVGRTVVADSVPIDLNAVDPGWPSVLGALYGPPVNRFDPTIADTVGWPGGRYVFAIQAPGFERWWGVEVEPPHVVPSPAAQPGGGPAASSRPASP